MMQNDDVDEEAFIYEYLGMEPGEEMVSDNAHDRYVGAFRALDNGNIVIPLGWKPGMPTHPRSHSSEDDSKYKYVPEPSLFTRIILCTIVLALFAWGVLALVS